ncbi:MAG TPA: MMPL family transporter [Candidatus Limnocylindrales bacterium]|nr:MMPL family transporter [Candidatus Limnocylindrales bacterium]
MSQTPPRQGQPWTVRVALWSARHRWPVFGLWFVLTIGIFVISLGMGGIRAVAATGGLAGSNTEAARGLQAMNSGAGATGAPSGETLTVVITSPTAKSSEPAFKATVATIVQRLDATSASVDGAAGPALTNVIDPYSAPPAAGLLAPDGAGVIVNARILGTSAQRETRAQAIATTISAAQAEFPAFAIHAVSNTLTNDQIGTVVNADLDGSLRISLPATFLILVLAFGAVVAAFVPLFLAITALLAAFGLLGIYSELFNPVSPYATQLVVLIGLAVAVDYSLFMVTRFRSERRAGRAKLAAIETASATAGRAVFFSGLAVMISLAGLFLLPDEIFHSMALGTIAVIMAAIAGSLTFVPATLAILGDGVSRLGVPFMSRQRGAGSGFWAALAQRVMSRPWVFAIGASVLLLALASPVLHMQLGESDLTTFPESVDGVQAVEALQAHWPQGTLLTLEVVVTNAQDGPTKAAIAALGPKLATIAGLSGPAQLGSSPDGSAASVSVEMSGSMNNPANWQIVRDVRGQVVPALFGSLPSSQVYVTGDAAESLDNTKIYTDGMVRVFLFVLTLSFLLLMVVFHSIVIPTKAILLNLLSTGAAYGAVVLVFQDGWFGSLLGVRPTDAIQNWIPIFIFTVLFGLSMDYEVFILSRIKEFVDHGADTRLAVARGLSVTAGTVTSAAAIMVVVFAVFMTLRLVIIRELGLGLAVAVFVDATVIRSLLLPATMRLLGEWNWYLPPFLRWLPRIRVEVEPVAPGAGDAA